MLEKNPITLKQLEDTLGTWNPKHVYSFGEASLTIAGLITGCGIQQLHGLSYIRKDNVPKYKAL